MVRDSIIYAKMSFADDASKYEKLHTDDRWSFLAIFARLRYGKVRANACEEYKRSVFFFTRYTYLFAVNQRIAIIFYGNLF